MITEKIEKFPSPYGVTVIKSQAINYQRERIEDKVSVPLRGNGN